MEKKYFSAFKLFYDEFIYKSNQFVSYGNVDANIDRIRDLVSLLRKYSIINIKKYMTFLGDTNKELKKELDKMYKLNKSLFDLYYIIYSSRVEYDTNKVEDMPFIISNSFYEDYRLDNKTVEELESSSYVVPKYSTLEKKNIRDEASDLSKLAYFVKLVEDLNNDKYNEFLGKAKIIINIRPKFNELKEDYLKRVADNISWFRDDFHKLYEMMAKTDDYVLISEKMEIAFRKKFFNWLDNFDALIEDHFDDLYSDIENNQEIKRYFNKGNEYTYDEYLKIADEVYNEKLKLEKIYECGGFHPVKYKDDSYFSRFREAIVNSYFDNRFLLNIYEDDEIKDYAQKTMELFSLSEDLENEIYDYYLFLASHSKRLGRCSDAKTAIILKLYDLYNPKELLYKYESVRSYFDRIIRNKDLDFKKEYDNTLFEQKKYFAYEGVIPTMKAVLIKFQNRLKKFILENYKDELVSQAVEYDTRNYDLSVLIDELEIDDIKELYSEMKENDNDRLPEIQKFVVTALIKKVYTNDDLDCSLYYDEICKNYLNEERAFN